MVRFLSKYIGCLDNYLVPFLKLRAEYAEVMSGHIVYD